MSSRIWLFICDVSLASVSPCSPVRPYTYFHRNNVVAAVPSVSARILLSIGDVSVASISPCVREYTDIYIEITLQLMCPLCPPEYGYLQVMFLQPVSAVPPVQCPLCKPEYCKSISNFSVFDLYTTLQVLILVFLVNIFTVYSIFAYFEGINFCSFMKIIAKVNTPRKIVLLQYMYVYLYVMFLQSLFSPVPWSGYTHIHTEMTLQLLYPLCPPEYSYSLCVRE